MGTDRSPVAVKAEALIEAMPWVARFQGRVVVVKFGGNAMVDDQLKHAFAQDMACLRQFGIHVVVVHGGGPQISAELKKRALTSEFRGGLRVTTPEVLTVVREVLTAQVGHEITELLNAQVPAGARPLAQAISGETDGLFRAERRGAVIDGELVDLGLVGDVAEVDPGRVLAMISAGQIPVVSSIAPDREVPEQSLNVNADSAAAALAVALRAERLVILTDVAGLYRDWPKRDSLVSRITTLELAGLIPTLESGMIPKMTACLDAVDGGVSSAAVLDGRIPHSVLLEAFAGGMAGTEVVGSEPSASAPSRQVKALK